MNDVNEANDEDTRQRDALLELDLLQRRLDELRSSLSRALVKEQLPTGEVDILVCQAQETHFALLLDSLDEVVAMCSLTPFPEASPWIAGLLNLRGEMIPILDLAARIRRGRHQPALDDFIVLCTREGERIGVVVQAITEVTRMSTATLQAVPSDLPQAPYVMGVTTIRDRPVYLLSLSSLRATSEIPSREERE